MNYAAVSTDPRRARLTVRNRESDQRREIPPDAWEFVDARTIRLLPGGTLFAPYKIYEVWYEATGSKVIGIGFSIAGANERMGAMQAQGAVDGDAGRRHFHSRADGLFRNEPRLSCRT